MLVLLQLAKLPQNYKFLMEGMAQHFSMSRRIANLGVCVPNMCWSLLKLHYSFLNGLVQYDLTFIFIGCTLLIMWKIRIKLA